MTTTQLNRDIKKLAKNLPDKTNEKELQAFYLEWRRLYLADQKFEYMNANSIRFMFRINQIYRFEAFSTFGCYIELPNEK